MEETTMRPKMLELKNWLKNKAVEIKETRKLHKEAQRTNNDNSYMGSLWHESYLYRHHHIAYSELKGRVRDQIEKPRQNNLPNEEKINKIKEKYTDGQETLRASA
jgi:hypothetical protein